MTCCPEGSVSRTAVHYLYKKKVRSAVAQVDYVLLYNKDKIGEISVR